MYISNKSKIFIRHRIYHDQDPSVSLLYTKILYVVIDYKIQNYKFIFIICNYYLGWLMVHSFDKESDRLFVRNIKLFISQTRLDTFFVLSEWNFFT